MAMPLAERSGMRSIRRRRIRLMVVTVVGEIKTGREGENSVDVIVR